MYTLFFLIYTFVAFFNWFICIQEYRFTCATKTVFLLFNILTISFLMALRPLEVADTLGYVEIYEQSDAINELSFRFGLRYKGIEYCFVKLMSIFKKLGFHFRVFFGIISSLTCYLMISGMSRCEKAITHRKSSNLITIWTIFLFYCGMHYCGIAIRSGLSIALGLCAVADWHEKKKIRSILLLVCSICMHSMGTLFICILILGSLKIRGYIKGFIIEWGILFLGLLLNASQLIISTVAGIALSFFRYMGIQGFDSYLSTFDYQVGLTDWYMLILIGIIILICNINNIFFEKMSAIVGVGLIILGIAYPIRAINRAYDFFIIFIIPIISSNIALSNKNKRILLWIMMPLLYVVQFKMCY